MSEWSAQTVVEAVEVLRASGLEIDDWTILGSSSRLVLELRPCKLIARVARLDAEVPLTLELAVAVHVASVGGPVAPPASSPGPYRAETVAITLWEPVIALEPLSETAVADAYSELRRSLSSFAETLPHLRESLLAISRQLAESKLPGVSDGDATFLRATFASRLAALSTFTSRDAVLHGDPHSGNVLNTPAGPRWLDFESACAGPVEWDLCALEQCPTDIACDPRLLQTLKTLRRVGVVLWCAMKLNPSAAELEALSHHLVALRAETTNR